MYSLKGTWAGQAFALASVNDSSGSKKSRIRRSKEERKTLVESFVKRYQSLNNGKFPSLNLTHKEVGGSFYTVREIVREIIQENRVLGPGQFSSEEQKDDVIAINYPLGTISSKPQAPLLEAANDFDFTTREGKETVVLSLDANGKYMEKKELDVVEYTTKFQANVIGEDVSRELVYVSKSDNFHSCELETESSELAASSDSSGKIFNVNDINDAHPVNHTDTNKSIENHYKPLVERLPESQTIKVGGESEQMGASHAKLTLPTEEVEVETFPLRHTVKESDDKGGASTDSKKFNASSINSEASTLAGEEVSSFDVSSDLVSRKAADSFPVPCLGGRFDVIMKDAEVNHVVVENKEVNQENSPLKDDSAVSSNQMSYKSANGDSVSATDKQNNLQPINASMGTTPLEDSNETSCNNAKEPTVLHGRAFKKDDKASVGSSPLNRIDLGSWRASKQETNPLLAFIKAFMDAFSRFWSE